MIWALVPARGGSKSIVGKNLASLGGRPLLDYGVLAAQASGCFSRIVCSTDDAQISTRARALGIEVDQRPPQLATDEASVADVAREFLRRAQPQHGSPEILVLIQPTSPFVLPGTICDLIAAMRGHPQSNSGQTVAPMPHNHHAWNQRRFEDAHVSFFYAEERKRAFNKQRKPVLFLFGNLVATRPAALLAGMDFFAEPSVGLPIDRHYALDIDQPDDLVLGDMYLERGLVVLPHVLALDR